MADFDDKAKDKIEDTKDKLGDMTDEAKAEYYKTHGRLDEKMEQRRRDTE
ncbi:MAG: hypothetical protein M3Q14_00630 [bacterium]|nr:hypothetical protein [bacterium]